MDVTDAEALEGFVRVAVLTGRAPDSLVALEDLARGRAVASSAGGRSGPADGAMAARASEPGGGVANPRVLVAISKLQAAAGLVDDALESARRASRLEPRGATRALEQMASILADAGNTVRLDEVVSLLEQEAPGRAPTLYYAAAAQFLHGNPLRAAELAERAIAADASFAPVHDLAGAAYAKVGRTEDARRAFERSLTFDAHDSTAYTNLGLLALERGDRLAARQHFAEALWLAPESRVAREGLSRSR
jgi:Flp pilus assembly protein TadD